MSQEYKQCTRCIMDTSAREIRFDENGLCNYCTDFLRIRDDRFNKKVKYHENDLQKFVKKIKDDGKDNEFDCVVGISGGVDSSWALVKSVECGLRPLAVHMDNGWNSELAQENISNLTSHLKVELYTHVIDWFEYRSLMQSFFNANVIDIELLYDNAMEGTCYQQAHKFKIKYILTGANYATEGMQIPKSWNWYKRDARNIRSINSKFNNVEIRTFPLISTVDTLRYEYINNIKWYPFLDYFEYNKEKSIKFMETNYSYKRYPFKHYESIFTRFYQGYILPKKFKVDKRILHYSTLIMSSQISREDAIKKMQNIPYESEELMLKDLNYFLKKMEWKAEDLNRYIDLPEIKHTAYQSELILFNTIRYNIPLFLKEPIKNVLKILN